MFRRWLIRISGIVLALLCIVTWGGSYWRTISVNYDGHIHYMVTTANGRLGIHRTDTRNLPADGWSFHYRPTEAFALVNWDNFTKYHSLGFCFHFDPSLLFATIPLWYLTLLTIPWLWFVWRKTHPKLAGRGFPIEPTVKSK